MADRFRGQIRLPKKFIEGSIVAAIASQFGMSRDEVLSMVKETPRNGIVDLTDEQAAYGEFSDLEGVLEAAGIPFDRSSEGFHELLPETKVFRPASLCGQPEQLVVQVTDGSGVALIDASAIKALMTLPPVHLKKRIERLLAEVYLDETSPLKKWASGALKPKKAPDFSVFKARG